MLTKHRASARRRLYLVALFRCLHDQIQEFVPIDFSDPVGNARRNADEVAGGDLPFVSASYTRPAKFVGLRFSGL